MESVRRRRTTVGAVARPRNLSLPSRSWWCCNHAPKGCHLAVVILSWALFSLLFCMPSFVTGQFVSRQNEVQDYSVDSSACGDHIKARASLALDSFVGDISGKLVESKDIQQSSIRGKHFCGYSQPCSPCMPAGFTAETDNSQRYSDEDAAKSSGKSLRWNQISNTYETKGERQDKSTENVTFRLIDGRTTVSCFPSSSHESNKETSIQTGKLEQMKTVTCGGSSSPNVAISPTVMEWGPQPVFSPSVAYLTVVNTCNDTVLHVFKPFSTNSQFYAYGFEQTVVASGEMISIAFVFLPRMLGLSGGHIILQTSSGGFLIQAQGEGVESPYRIEPFTGLNAFSGTRFRDNMTLYNPFDEMIFVEEVFAWVANSEAGLTQPAGAVCKTNGAFETSNKNLLQNEDAWFEFGKDAMDISLLGIRPSGRWEISPQCSSTIMEIDVSTHMEGKILGALCIRLKNSLRDTSNTVIVPLEVQIANIVENNPPIQLLSKVLKSDVENEREQTVKVILSLNNVGSEVIRLEKICESSEDRKLLQIRYLPGLILFPGTVTHVAAITYNLIKKTMPSEDYEIHPSSIALDCKLFIITNDTISPQLEVLCHDLISNSVEHNHASVAVFSESLDGVWNALNGRNPNNGQDQFHFSYSTSSSLLKEMTFEFMTEADELFLKNWKLQGSSENSSVLVQSKLSYPMIEIGKKGSKWVNVSNPSQQPVVMQLILNSKAIAGHCKDDDEVGWEPSHSLKIEHGLFTKTADFDGDDENSHVFSLPENGVTEAYVHPHGRASFGPILFHPSKRCVWTGSVLIKNNLSGVEWLPIQGAGGSMALTFLEGAEPVQALHFNFNMPSIPLSTMGAMKFYSHQLFHRAGIKAACIKPVLKGFLARNTGDMHLEVKTIKVAGNACGSDGFRIHTCDGFILAPGESTELLISYQTDFSASVIYRDLQLALSSGSVVIPMKASLPSYMVIFYQKSFFWLIVRKTILFICIAASLMFVVFCRLLAQDTATVGLDQWPQNKKSANAEVGKIDREMHSESIKQRSQSASKVLDTKCAQLKDSAIKVEITKEQNTASVLSKTLDHAWEGTGSCNCHTGPERNYAQSDHEQMKWLNDAKNKDSINSDFNTGQSKDNTVSKVSDAQNYSFPSAAPESLNSVMDSNEPERNCGTSHSKCEHMKWLHDKKNKLFLNSDMYGSISTGYSKVSNAETSFLPYKDPVCLNSNVDSNPPALSPNISSQQVAPHAGHCLTVKLEKEKGRRRKKRSGAITKKQEVSGSQSGNSTPTSPASPITPIASSRPVSPLVKTVWQSNLMPSNSGGANDLEHPAESAGYKSLVVHKFPGITLQRDGDDVSQAGLVADVFKKHSAEVSGSKLPDESSFKQSSSQKQLSGVAAFSSKAISKQKNAGEGAVASGDWAAVAKRSADLSLNNSKFMRSDKTVLDSSSKMVRPMLTTSATFPFGGRRESNSGWHLPVLLDPKQTMVSSPSTPSLVSRSAIAPHARAPGTKFTKNESVSREHNTRGKSELIEQQSTYDIWGNHFAEFHLMSRSNVSAATTGQTKRSMYSSSEDYSQSYFSRFAPQTHLEKVTVPSLSSSASESFRPFPTD